MRVGLLSAILLGIAFGTAHAAKESNVAMTKHNLSVTSPGTVKATSESGICVFCHTPHGAANAEGAPLWNRSIPASGTYTLYGSGSMQAGTITDIATPSKLCLTCHDGTQALGAVSNAPGSGIGAEIPMAGGVGAKMPGDPASGVGANLGTNLTNDHPISITYDTALSGADKELHDPATAPHIVNTYSGRTTNVMPLNKGKVECASCHDPHLYDPAEDIKFLRLNRFQSTTAPSGDGTFSATNDIICIACHKKEGWAGSAHADAGIANETYTDAAATARGFPTGLPVYRAACLNCHDPHTVQGAQRLQRQQKTEQTCYQCHSNTPILTDATQVPNIEKDFQLTYKMPLDKNNGDGTEMHKILDGDFTESAATLSGPANDNTMRHAECTDCHNPHRVAKNTQADLGGSNLAATHQHQDGVVHTNVASGVLRGAWGVEPNYATLVDNEFITTLNQTTGYTVKKGLGADAVSKEYQVCLKCHSSYAFGTNPPTIGASIGQNGLNKYTDQAKEFYPPATHKGEVTAPTNGGWATDVATCPPDCNFTTNNHRSWHPVIDGTGRGEAARGTGVANAFVSPWNAPGALGNQTMYCSDCHGSTTAIGTVVPNIGENWGPHGSNNPFILKGPWNNQTGTNQQDGLCFKCHKYADYADPTNAAPNPSGFRTPATWTGMGMGMCSIDTALARTNLHIGHAKIVGGMGGGGGGMGGGGGGGQLKCNWCHAAVPHGWKNKALLVNINDIGPEAVNPNTGSPWPIKGVAMTSPVNSEPYYINAMLGIINFKRSGEWTPADCGGYTTAGGTAVGVGWMSNTCSNPP
ncbi:MAG: cytochrome c3 family protein [Pseudomonadota bacterium]